MASIASTPLRLAGFCKEYDEVLEHTMKLGLSSEVSQTEENKQKNRYQNIDACKSPALHLSSCCICVQAAKV